MFDFLIWGSYILEMIDKLGEFLMIKPLSWFLEYTDWAVSLGYDGPMFFIDFLNGIGSASVAELIFGGMLSTVLILRIISFVTDIIS